MMRPRAALLLAASISALGCEAIQSRLEPERDLYRERQRERNEADARFCRRMIPDATRQRFLPGLKSYVMPNSVAGGVTCVYVPEGADPSGFELRGEPGARVLFLCQVLTTSPESLQSAADLYKSGERVEGLGKMAIRFDTRQIKVWDGDTDCMIDIVRYGGEASELLSFAEELERTLSPDTLAAAQGQ